MEGKEEGKKSIILSYLYFCALSSAQFIFPAWKLNIF